MVYVFGTGYSSTTPLIDSTAFSIVAAEYDTASIRGWSSNQKYTYATRAGTPDTYTQPLTVFSRGGGSESLIGDIAELLVFEGSDLTATERGLLFDYLATKWAVAGP